MTHQAMIAKCIAKANASRADLEAVMDAMFRMRREAALHQRGQGDFSSAECIEIATEVRMHFIKCGQWSKDSLFPEEGQFFAAQRAAKHQVAAPAAPQGAESLPTNTPAGYVFPPSQRTEALRYAASLALAGESTPVHCGITYFGPDPETDRVSEYVNPGTDWRSSQFVAHHPYRVAYKDGAWRFAGFLATDA